MTVLNLFSVCYSKIIASWPVAYDKLVHLTQEGFVIFLCVNNSKIGYFVSRNVQMINQSSSIILAINYYLINKVLKYFYLQIANVNGYYNL